MAAAAKILHIKATSIALIGEISIKRRHIRQQKSALLVVPTFHFILGDHTSISSRDPYTSRLRRALTFLLCIGVKIVDVTNIHHARIDPQ